MSDEERSESATDTQDEASSRDDASAEEAGPADRADGSDRLSEEIREQLKELEELRNRHLRLAAEFENYRKRTRRELGDARERGQAELAGRLLDALDDLDRLVESLEEDAAGETLEEGVEMVRRKLWKELSEAGLARIEAEGEPFDPEVHEGLLTSPTDDPDEDRRVARVMIQGYRFGDRVLRPARVEVKKYADENADDEDGEA
jgi:molecular chaperone GrpE